MSALFSLVRSNIGNFGVLHNSAVSNNYRLTSVNFVLY